MASLKEINSSVQEGNEDLQKLNENFASWLSMVKTSGDDLEAAKEARLAKKTPVRGGMSNVFQRDLLGKKKGGLFGTGMGLKTLIGLTALMAPVIFDLFKDEIAKYLKNLLGGPNKSLGDLIEEYLRKMLDKPVTNLPRQIKIPKGIVPPSVLNPPPKTVVPKINPKLNPNIPLNQNPRNPALDSRGKPIPVVPRGTVNPNAPTGRNPYTNPSQGIFNNAQKNTKTGRFQSIPKGMGQSPGAMGGRTMGVSPGAMGGKIKAAGGKSALARILAKFNPMNGNRGSDGHWFTSCVDAIAKFVPSWIRTFLKKVVGFMLNRGMKILFVFEIILIVCDLRLDLSNPLAPKIVPYKYGPIEKAVKIAALPIALYISSLGAFIGGIVGTATLGPVYGTAIGAVVGGITAYTASYQIIMILLEFYEGGDYSAKAFGKLLEKHLAPAASERLSAELQAARDKKMGKAGLKNTSSQTRFAQQASMPMQVVADQMRRGDISQAAGFARQNQILSNVESQFYDAAGNTTPFLKEQRQKLLSQIPVTSSFGQMVPSVSAGIIKSPGGSTLQSSVGSQYFRGTNPLTEMDKDFFFPGQTSGGGGVSTSFTDQSQRTDTKVTVAVGGSENFHSRNADLIDPWMPMAGTFRTA